jgi:hypothetical protein
VAFSLPLLASTGSGGPFVVGVYAFGVLLLLTFLLLLAILFVVHALSVADPGCLSRIRLFSIPYPKCLHPGSRILIKEFKYINPKKAKKMVSKLLKNMIRVVHPGSG